MNPLAFQNLTPDTILDAVELTGLRPDGHLLALNSYENRVYQIGIEDSPPLVAKFYRPERWSDAAIQEEHAFSLQLAEAEIPVVPPLVLKDQTLHHAGEFRFTLFARQGGRTPELGDLDTLHWIGRFLGRIHAVGATQAFQHRETLSPETFGHEPLHTILDGPWLPPELHTPFATIAREALHAVEATYARHSPRQLIRLHGDCHPGNLLWTDAGPHFVDMDDSRMGPAMQDLWMLLSGDRQQQSLQLSTLVEGYEEFADFDRREVGLLEALRTLRLLHYSAWLARRWEDPAFQQAFPWFATHRFWEQKILELREQLALLQEPPLVI